MTIEEMRKEEGAFMEWRAYADAIDKVKEGFANGKVAIRGGNIEAVNDIAANDNFKMGALQ
jgi:hypothetical protein